MRGEREYARLVEALGSYEPPCASDGRYIADTLSADDIADMREACAVCPARRECRGAAVAMRAEAGFWAGEQYPTDRPPGRPRKEKPE